LVDGDEESLEVEEYTDGGDGEIQRSTVSRSEMRIRLVQTGRERLL